MKKQTLTQQDIQRDLLAKISKRKPIAIFLTFLTTVSILCYVLFIINFKGKIATGEAIHGRSPIVALFVGAICILFFIIFLLDYYYIDLYKIQKGHFTITEQKLLASKKEMILYARQIAKENSLYFSCGRVAVNTEVSRYSRIGDRFYAVVLRPKKSPLLVYHMNYYHVDFK